MNPETMSEIKKWKITETGRFTKYDGFNWYECEPEEIIETLEQEVEKLKEPAMDEIALEPVYGSTMCQYSWLENKLATLYQNQEKLLQAILKITKEK